MLISSIAVVDFRLGLGRYVQNCLRGRQQQLRDQAEDIASEAFTELLSECETCDDARREIEAGIVGEHSRRALEKWVVRARRDRLVQSVDGAMLFTMDFRERDASAKIERVLAALDSTELRILCCSNPRKDAKCFGMSELELRTYRESLRRRVVEGL